MSRETRRRGPKAALSTQLPEARVAREGWEATLCPFIHTFAWRAGVRWELAGVGGQALRVRPKPHPGGWIGQELKVSWWTRVAHARRGRSALKVRLWECPAPEGSSAPPL